MDKKSKKTKKRIPKQKQKQKQKVIQKVSVNVNSSGGCGGSTMPSQNYPSQQMIPNFIKSNEQEKNLIKSLVDLLNKLQTISRQPQEVLIYLENRKQKRKYTAVNGNTNGNTNRRKFIYTT